MEFLIDVALYIPELCVDCERASEDVGERRERQEVFFISQMFLARSRVLGDVESGSRGEVKTVAPGSQPASLDWMWIV